MNASKLNTRPSLGHPEASHGEWPRLRFKIMDVRPILARGEDPFQQIRNKIGRLAPAEGLTVIAPFIPAPLIEVLRSEGFSSTLEHRVDGGWAVNFWRA